MLEASGALRGAAAGRGPAGVAVPPNPWLDGCSGDRPPRGVSVAAPLRLPPAAVRRGGPRRAAVRGSGIAVGSARIAMGFAAIAVAGARVAVRFAVARAAVFSTLSRFVVRAASFAGAAGAGLAVATRRAALVGPAGGLPATMSVRGRVAPGAGARLCGSRPARAGSRALGRGMGRRHPGSACR